MELISHVLSQIATHVKTLFTSSSWRHHGADSLTEVETKPEALAPEITLAIHQNCLLFPKTSSRTIQMTDDRGPFPFPAI